MFRWVISLAQQKCSGKQRDSACKREYTISAPNIGTISREYRLQGRFIKPLNLFVFCKYILRNRTPKSIYVSDYAYLGTIDVLREWNHLEEAEKWLETHWHPSEPWNSHNCTCPCATLLARILMAEGKLDEAQSALDLAAKVIQRNVPFGDISSDLNQSRSNIGWQLEKSRLPRIG